MIRSAYLMPFSGAPEYWVGSVQLYLICRSSGLGQRKIASTCESEISRISCLKENWVLFLLEAERTVSGLAGKAAITVARVPEVASASSQPSFVLYRGYTGVIWGICLLRIYRDNGKEHENIYIYIHIYIYITAQVTSKP